jgi:hypothetical protein
MMGLHEAGRLFLIMKRNLRQLGSMGTVIFLPLPHPIHVHHTTVSSLTPENYTVYLAVEDIPKSDGKQSTLEKRLALRGYHRSTLEMRKGKFRKNPSSRIRLYS